MGINRNPVAFDLRSEVAPVALVDSSVDFSASPNPAYRVVDVFSGGEVVAPAVNTVLADTGPLPVGSYTLQLTINAQENNDFAFQWRDAPNTASLISQVFRNGTITRTLTVVVRFEVQNANERFRILNQQAGNVGIVYQVSIFTRI